MSWRLTAGERRIIERTRLNLPVGESDRAERKPATPPDAAPVPLWKSVLSWVGAIAFLVFLALLMLYIGTLVG